MTRIIAVLAILGALACGDDEMMMDVPDAGSDAGEQDSGGGLQCALATVPLGGMIPTMTMGESNDYEPPAGCVAESTSGPDRVYGVQADEAGTYRVTATPLGAEFDVLIYALNACDATSCLDGSNDGGPGEPEVIEIDLDAGQLAFIVLDTDPDDSTGGASTLAAELL